MTLVLLAPAMGLGIAGIAVVLSGDDWPFDDEEEELP